MNKANGGLSPSRRRLILWLAQINSVVVLTVLAWALPGFDAVTPVPEARQPLLMAALLSLPLVLILSRWLMVRARGQGQGPNDPASRAEAAGRAGRAATAVTDMQDQAQVLAGRELGLAVIAWALCELPLLLGFVYVLLGGDRLHAVALGAASLALLLLSRPSSAP